MRQISIVTSSSQTSVTDITNYTVDTVREGQTHNHDGGLMQLFCDTVRERLTHNYNGGLMQLFGGTVRERQTYNYNAGLM